MEELYIPTEVWNCVARYYENPVLLLRLAEVCRNSYKGATMDSAWEPLIPYECKGNLYRAFIGAALATSENNRCIIRSCWTGHFPPKDCFPDVPFERKDYDTAFALAAQKEHLGQWQYGYLVSRRGHNRRLCPEKYSYLFDKCVRSRKFMVTVLKICPWLFDMYYNPPEGYNCQFIRGDPEYCEVAMPLSAEAWVSAKMGDFPVWENYELKKNMLALNPRAFTHIFDRLHPCSVQEFILGSAPFYRARSALFYPGLENLFIRCCDPDIFGPELCEELCKIGFPIWIAKPDIEASFLKRFKSFTMLPPMFANDREIFESVAKNDCKILENAIPEFRKDISLVISIFEHNPGVLHFCDASLFVNAEFLRRFQEALKKPNRFFYRTWPDIAHPSRQAFPGVLQTQELALIAVESYGQWIHYFPRFWADLEVVRTAVVTWPMAYFYARYHWKVDRDDWNKTICRANPRAVWAAGKRFINENRSIVHKALQLGPLQDGSNYFPYHSYRFCLRAENIERVLPEILRADPRNYEILCLEEMNRRFILGKKMLIIAALEGTRDSSILWDVPPGILDRDIWNKAREVRR